MPDDWPAEMIKLLSYVLDALDKREEHLIGIHVQTAIEMLETHQGAKGIPFNDN